MKIILMLGAIGLLLCGCSQEEEVKLSSDSKDKTHLITRAENIDKSSYAGLEDVFLDTKHLYTQKDNKLTLFIFGKNNCPYCDKLKDDIKANSTLKSMLQEHFLPYYINVSYNKKHILSIGENTQEANTPELMELYVKSPMRPTPSLIFINAQGKSIYELPGYLPPEAMQKLLAYMASGEWKGKSEEEIATHINGALL